MEGGLQQVFFLKHMVRVSKKPGVAFGSPAEVPQILPPNPKIWVIMTNHPILLNNPWRGIVAGALRQTPAAIPP